MSVAIVEMTAKGFGCVGITGADGKLTGIITDGDLRRHMRPDLLAAQVDDVMTKTRRRQRRSAGQRSAGAAQLVEDHRGVRARGRQTDGHRAPARSVARGRGVELCLRMILSENRFTLFGIMRYIGSTTSSAASARTTLTRLPAGHSGPASRQIVSSIRTVP